MTTILCIAVIAFCVIGTASLLGIYKSIVTIEVRGIKIDKSDEV